MDKKRKEYYRKKLEQKREELKRHIASEEEAGREAANGDTTQDLGDRAASSYTKEFLFSQSDGERAQLYQVEEALKRLDGNGFGVCEVCGEAVQQKRLEAVPWALLCIECQEKAEKGLLEETL